MASRPTPTFRATAGSTLACPSRALSRPVTSSASVTAATVTGSRAAGPGSTIASSGSSAPRVKDTSEASDACHGLTTLSGSMPSSASAWAASALRAVSWTATWCATSGVSPLAS